MHEVYRNRDFSKVGLYNEILKDAGIRTMLRNWNGANITDIPIPDLFPNICVFTEEDYKKAIKILTEYEKPASGNLEEWVCSQCGETVDGCFSECWACQTPIKEE